MAMATDTVRPQVRGKFIFAGADKLHIRGVTYGTFRPGRDGSEYPEPAIAERDLAGMAANGFNAFRTYSVPPLWLLNMAQRQGLLVMAGVPVERFIAFLDGRSSRQRLERQVQSWVRSCAGHPAILCYALGNEIPSSLVRWHGPKEMSRFLYRLYCVAKAEDPDGLFTYVNYPSTEYLQLPFLDFASFNVYLEAQDRVAAYLSRLQNIASDRPLVLAEVGLDSQRNGEEEQGIVLGWQVRTAVAGGAAGVFVYAWTDEWHRGGADVEDWNFGLTDHARHPKPALAAVREAFAEALSPGSSWPRISVVVCSYNGARTIRDALEGLRHLRYPDYEVIVIDDGSIDSTPAIGREYNGKNGFRLISSENRGLSNARNLGLAAATGEIVAYIDDDAFPDPDWLTYLAITFRETDYVAVGGPNLAPSGDGPIADCIANAPGGPTHILLSDTEAEHIPGCNMAFRRSALEAIGGFDPQFRVAGDDIDVCWRLRDRGWSLGFCPAALVWHHRRNSIRTYWKQQRGYGKAEALLERKWPEKYNTAGHATWAGRLYGRGITRMLSWCSERVYHGAWGTAPFQSLYQSDAGLLCSLPLMPEWYLLVLALAVLSAFGLLWTPLLLALPLLALALGPLLLQAGLSAAGATFANQPRSRLARTKLHILTALLHLLQPLARLHGRLCGGLTPWRWRYPWRFALPRPGKRAIWNERWQDPVFWLRSLEKDLRSSGAIVVAGGEYDRWDLEARGGMLGATRLSLAVEELGQGVQLLRFRHHPVLSRIGVLTSGLLVLIAVGAALDHGWLVSSIFGVGAFLLALRGLAEVAVTTAAIRASIKGLADRNEAATELGTLGLGTGEAMRRPGVAQRNNGEEPEGRGDGQ